MFAYKNPMAAPSYRQSEFMDSSEREPMSSVGRHQHHVEVVGQHPDTFSFRFGEFVRQCWQHMKTMDAEFQQSDSDGGARSRERSRERLVDEEAWLRMDK